MNPAEEDEITRAEKPAYGLCRNQGTAPRRAASGIPSRTCYKTPLYKRSHRQRETSGRMPL